MKDAITVFNIFTQVFFLLLSFDSFSKYSTLKDKKKQSQNPSERVFVKKNESKLFKPFNVNEPKRSESCQSLQVIR